MPGPGDILITVDAATHGAVGALGNVKTALDETASTGDRLKAGLKAAAIPAAIAFAALAAEAVKAAHAAEAHQAVMERLATSLHNTTGATDEQAAAVGKYLDNLELASGIAESQLAPAFQVLAKATGDTGQAQDLLNVAMDVSAATGKDVTSVANAMAKAHEGNIGALARVVPGLSAATKASGDFDTAIKELSSTTSGAWQASAATAEGQQRRLAVAIEQLQRALGEALLPIIQAVLPLLIQLATFAADNAKAIQILAGIVGVLSAGILAANVALKAYESIQIAVKIATAAWSAAQWLLNAALDANPIGVVVLAVAALAAGIVIAYKHSATFREIVQGALSAVEAAARSLAAGFEALFAAAKAAFDWIVAHWQLGLFAFGPLGAAVYAIATNWDTVAGAAKAAADAMIGAINAVIGAIEGAIHAVERLISALGSIHVPSIHLPSLSDVNPFGAVALAPAGYGRSAASFAPRGARSSSPLVVNVYGAVDPEGTARTIRRILDSHDRRMGRSS